MNNISFQNTYNPNPFERDILDLFQYKKMGHCSAWGYSGPLFEGDKVNGAKLWDLFSRCSSDYYLYRNEVSLIHYLLKKYPRLFQCVENIIDFGPGKAVRDKTVPFLQVLEDVKNYISVDMSDDFLKKSCDLMGGYGLQTQAIKSDFFSDHMNLPENSLGLMMGGTIMNGSCYDFSSRLQAIRQSFKGYLLVSYDTNHDQDALLKAYSHPLHALQVQNMMYRVERDLLPSTGFNPEEWIYKPVWKAKEHVLDHCLVAERDQHFYIGQSKVDINAGQEFIIERSFKLPILKFTHIAAKTGFQTHATFMDDDNFVAIQLLKAA